MGGNTLLVVAAVIVGLAGLAGCGGTPPGDEDESGDDAILAAAFRDRVSDLQVQGSGTVTRLLPDDDEGSRHQRFIVRLDSGQTLLVAHNLDVAPGVEGLAVGDEIAFRGVYEWSAEGGTIHWTHEDPDGDHAPGWLRHDAKTYQ